MAASNAAPARPRRTAWRGLLAGAAACILSLAAAAQILPPIAAGTSPPAAEQEVRDPLGRGTPRGTITSFIRAVQRDDFLLASRYLQAKGKQREEVEDLARDLAALMDRHFHEPLSSISDAPEGRLDDGLALDRERLGPLRIGGEEHHIELVKVEDPDAGPVWLVSTTTLSRVSEWRAESQPLWFEHVLPAAVARYTVAGMPLGAILAWAASLLLPLLGFTAVFTAVARLTRRLVRGPELRARLDALLQRMRWPLVWLMALVVHLLAVPWFGTTLGFRDFYSRLVVVAVLAVLAWALLRWLMLWLQRARLLMQRRGRSGAGSLMLLGERLGKVVILVFAALAILAVAGVDIATALAGLGIVGIAVALGAQRTVENILGGILLLGDEAFAIGDFCSISNRLGVVEDITLRSVRIRTLEQTLLLIPAGVLAQAHIENFSSRGKILAQSTLRLAHDTSSAQLRSIRQGIADALARDPMVETASSRVRLVEFGPRGIELEMFAFVLTSEWPRFLAVREELLLQAAAIVEAAGATFARPWANEQAITA